MSNADGRLACEHLNFAAQVSVNRLTNEIGGYVTGYSADLKISCVDCGFPFRWLGVEHGYSLFAPRTCVAGEELRAPLEPAYVAEIFGQPNMRGTA